MRSKRTEAFRQLLKALPKEVRRRAYQAYRQFKRDPYHPSLHFKRLQSPDIYSVRIGAKYRALGRREHLIVWFWTALMPSATNAPGNPNSLLLLASLICATVSTTTLITQ